MCLLEFGPTPPSSDSKKLEKSEKIEKQEMMENDELLMKRDDMKRLKLTAKEILSTSPKKMSLTGKKSPNCETEDRILFVKKWLCLLQIAQIYRSLKVTGPMSF